MTKSNRDLINKLKIVTFDIETYKDDNGIFIPYACGWYNGKHLKTYYLSEFNSSYEMLLQSIKDLIKQNSNSCVYVHNLSSFDYLFLSKPIFENFYVNPLYKDNKIISLKIRNKDNNNNNNNNTITVFDSYLILPASLRQLAITYKVENLKGIFPYDFVTSQNLNYVGDVPSLSYYNSLNEIEYNNLLESFKNKQWSLKNETIIYLESDLKSLFQVVHKFASDIYIHEKIDISNCPTNSSIALKIFRTHHLKDKTLPLVKGIAHKNMRNAYYGGVVEVYKNMGYNLKLYDVNSLYPFSMLNPMPTGNPIFSTDHNLDNYFGIVFVSVNTYNLLENKQNYPLLPIRLDQRMYNVLGQWSGWYFSEEIKLAKSLGYDIKVHYGYKFDKTYNLFDLYVNKFFNIKAGINVNSTMEKQTAKLLLNSLYGRLGMNPNLDNIKIVNNEEANNILSKYEVKEHFSITNDLDYIKYSNSPILQFQDIYSKEEYLDFVIKCDNSNFSINQSLPAAIAITAYSRMYMFNIIYRLLELGYTIYYMDTDSLVINAVLPSDLIGMKLGQFKLESSIKEGIFISPKIYYLKTDNNVEIKKCKGIGNKLTRDDYFNLLNGNNVIINQERWHRSPINGYIQSKPMDINISPQMFKRQSIIIDNQLSHTIPLTVEDNVFK